MGHDTCVESTGEGPRASSCIHNKARSAFVLVIKFDLPFARKLRDRIQSAILVEQAATPTNSKPEVIVEAIAVHMPQRAVGFEYRTLNLRLTAPCPLALMAFDVPSVSEHVPHAERLEWRADGTGKRLATPRLERRRPFEDNHVTSTVEKSRACSQPGWTGAEDTNLMSSMRGGGILDNRFRFHDG